MADIAYTCIHFICIAINVVFEQFTVIMSIMSCDTKLNIKLAKCANIDSCAANSPQTSLMDNIIYLSHVYIYVYTDIIMY